MAHVRQMGAKHKCHCCTTFSSTTFKPDPSPRLLCLQMRIFSVLVYCAKLHVKSFVCFPILCALFQVDLSCAVLTLGPLGWERQQMGLGQRADASDSKRPGCWVEAVSVRKLLFPGEPTNHWRKLKMSPLRNAIKSSKKLQSCRWCAAVWLFGC